MKSLTVPTQTSSVRDLHVKETEQGKSHVAPLTPLTKVQLSGRVGSENMAAEIRGATAVGRRQTRLMNPCTCTSPGCYQLVKAHAAAWEGTHADYSAGWSLVFCKISINFSPFALFRSQHSTYVIVISQPPALGCMADKCGRCLTAGNFCCIMLCQSFICTRCTNAAFFSLDALKYPEKLFNPKAINLTLQRTTHSCTW